MAFTKTEQRRITFLSLLSSAVQLAESNNDAYTIAGNWLKDMEEDGFFEEERTSNPTPQRSGRSDRPAFRGQSSRSSDRPSRGPRDASAPASEKQVNFALRLGADYSREELEEMTMGEIGGLIEDLKG